MLIYVKPWNVWRGKIKLQVERMDSVSDIERDYLQNQFAVEWIA